MREVGEQGLAPRVLVDAVADVAVEVAIGAFARRRTASGRRARASPSGAGWQRRSPHPRPSLQAGSAATSLRERVGAVADRVLFRRVDLAEGLVVAGGDEHRVVAEALVAARRPDQRAVDPAFEALDLAVVGPGERQARRRNARRGPASGPAASTSRQTRSIAAAEVAVAGLVLGPARREDARAAVERVDAQPAVVGERGQAATGRPLSRAFKSALSTKVLPISSGSGRPSSAAPTQSMPSGASSSPISRSLPGIVGRDDQFGTDRLHRPVAFSCAAKISVQPIRARRSRRSRPSSSKRLALGGELRLDDRAVAGQHEIAVAAGVAVLVIIEVEHRRAVVDAAADRRDLGADRVGGDAPCSRAACRPRCAARPRRPRSPRCGCRRRPG